MCDRSALNRSLCGLGTRLRLGSPHTVRLSPNTQGAYLRKPGPSEEDRSPPQVCTRHTRDAHISPGAYASGVPSWNAPLPRSRGCGHLPSASFLREPEGLAVNGHSPHHLEQRHELSEETVESVLSAPFLCSHKNLLHFFIPLFQNKANPLSL